MRDSAEFVEFAELRSLNSCENADSTILQSLDSAKMWQILRICGV
ncbi:hypothetical protein [Helicobacter sp. 23-1045]